MDVTSRGLVLADFGQFYVQSPEGLMVQASEDELVWPFEDGRGIFVLTSVHSGDVPYTAVGTSSEPEAPDGEWEVTVEAQITAPDGVIIIRGWGGETDNVNLAVSGEGTYGVRIWGRGRDLEPGWDVYDTPAAESYHIAVWPKG